MLPSINTKMNKQIPTFFSAQTQSTHRRITNLFYLEVDMKYTAHYPLFLSRKAVEVECLPTVLIHQIGLRHPMISSRTLSFDRSLTTSLTRYTKYGLQYYGKRHFDKIKVIVSDISLPDQNTYTISCQPST